MYDSRTPPDVVSSTGGCRGSRPEVDSTSTFRSPTQKIRDDRSPVYTLPTSLSSSSPVLASLPLTSSTPERATNETVSRHVDVLLDEPASSPSCLDVTDDGGCVHRPTDHDVGQTPTHWKRRRRPTKSMIVISEDDVDDLFQPVNINGDSFALLQTPISDGQTLQRTAQRQQAGIILSVEALQCMLAKLACSPSSELQNATTMPPTFAARSRHQQQTQPYAPPNSQLFTDHKRVSDDRSSSDHKRHEEPFPVSPNQNVNTEQSTPQSWELHDTSRHHSAENGVRHLMTSSTTYSSAPQLHQKHSGTVQHEALVHETPAEGNRTKQRVGAMERSQTVTARRRRCVDDPRLRVAVADADVAARLLRCINVQPHRPAVRHLLPGKLSNVTLNVSGRCSLYVAFNAPINTQDTNDVTATRFCVEWSYFDNFSRVVGSHVIEDEHAIGYDIQGLEPGNCYFVRVRAGNDHGFGCPTSSTPPGATTSNWRDFEEMTSRHEGKQQVLDDLMETWSNIVGGSTASSASNLKNVESSSSKVRKTFKSLFTSTVRLQKTLRRGLFMAALVHHEGRILVTGDDVIPMIDVDAEFSSAALNTDLYWLMKVASSSWYDLKSIEQRLTSCSSSQSLQFRTRLLHALQQLQSALGIHDLGQFHYTPVIDEASGATLLVSVRSLDDGKAFDSTHVRWMSLKKAQMRGCAKATSPAVDVPVTTTDRPRSLLDGAHDMIVHRHLSGQVLPRGLYVGLLQLRSSRDAISVLVSRHQPNVLPYVKIRDNPNVTSEEWRWLVNEKLQDNSLWLRPVVRSPTPAQRTLQNQLNEACSKLLTDLDKTEQEGRNFRLYDLEVLEFNNDVSFLLLLPPVESVCNSPFDEREKSLFSRECTYVPVQAFEMLNLQTYQPDLMRRYCQLSVYMETDAAAAQHELRQAFSTDDAAVARRKMDAVTELQRAVDDCWKTVRWLADATAYARDRNVRNGLPLGALFSADVAPTSRRRTTVKPEVGRGSDATASVVGSDSDYHSDISNYSADCPATRHYQPVLL